MLLKLEHLLQDIAFKFEYNIKKQFFIPETVAYDLTEFCHAKNKLSDNEDEDNGANKNKKPKIEDEPEIKSESLKDVVEPKKEMVKSDSLADSMMNELICTICNEIMHDCVRYV